MNVVNQDSRFRNQNELQFFGYTVALSNYKFPVTQAAETVQKDSKGCILFQISLINPAAQKDFN